jgi:hypothetical protein
MIEMTIIEPKESCGGVQYQSRIFRTSTEREENDRIVWGSGNGVWHVSWLNVWIFPSHSLKVSTNPEWRCGPILSQKLDVLNAEFRRKDLSASPLWFLQKEVYYLVTIYGLIN